MANATEEDFPKTTLESTWACWEDELETVIKDELGSSYDELINQVKNDLGFNKNKEVMKNPEGMAMLVRSAYDQGHKMSTLEQLIDKIDEMLS